MMSNKTVDSFERGGSFTCSGREERAGRGGEGEGEGRLEEGGDGEGWRGEGGV